MTSSYYVFFNHGDNYLDYSYDSACKKAKALSNKYGKAEIIKEDPYWYKGYRFWIWSVKSIFIDGKFSHDEEVNVLYSARSGTYLPIEEWKKEQDRWFYEYMSRKWIETNYGE